MTDQERFTKPLSVKDREAIHDFVDDLTKPDPSWQALVDYLQHKARESE